MSVLNNLKNKYLDEEKTKAKDKFTFIFQSDKDEEVDIQQLKTNQVYHVIDEPQFNENDGNNTRGSSRIPCGLETTILGGMKKYRVRNRGLSLLERQFQKQQQTSELQIQRQVLFEKKGKTLKENIIQQKREKVLQMKTISENKLKEQEQIAKDIMDIHKKGHLVYVDYGEEQNITVKELRQSPKQSDLQQINYSKIIKKTQEYLDQEEKYEQIKKDLQFKFNFKTDKPQHSLDHENSKIDNINSINDISNSIQEQDKTLNNKSQIKFNENSIRDNNLSLKDHVNNQKNRNSIKDCRNVSPMNGQKIDPYITLKEGDININSQQSKDQKVKINKDSFKDQKNDSTNFLVEKDHETSEERLNRDSSLKLHYKPSLSQNQKLKNSHSEKQGHREDKMNTLQQKIEPYSLEAKNLQDKENNNLLKQRETNICKTQYDQIQQKQTNLRTVNSQLGNVIHKKQEEQNNLRDKKQKSENIQSLNGLNTQKPKIKNKIAQQRLKFDELINQISFATNNQIYGRKSVSPSLDLKENQYKQQNSNDENQIFNEKQKPNQSKKHTQVEQSDNYGTNENIKQIILPQINKNLKRLQNQENQSSDPQMIQKNKYYSNQNSSQQSNIQYNGSNSYNIKENDQTISRLENRDPFDEYQKSLNNYNAIDKSRETSRRNQSQNSRLKEYLRNNSQNSKFMDNSRLDNSRLVDNTKLQGGQKLKQDILSSNKESSFLGQSSSTAIDTSLMKTHESSLIKSNILQKQMHAVKHYNNSIKQNSNKSNEQQQNEQLDEVRNQSISIIQPYTNQKIISPLIIFNQDQTSISFLNNLNSVEENTPNSKCQQEKSTELNENLSQLKLNEQDKNKIRSKTLQNAEQLLNRIKKKSEHYQEHQEQIQSQMDNFSCENVKQKQIKILQTFKDQKVPDMIKKRLHHDFIDILAMYKN